MCEICKRIEMVCKALGINAYIANCASDNPAYPRITVSFNKTKSRMGVLGWEIEAIVKAARANTYSICSDYEGCIEIVIELPYTC